MKKVIVLVILGGLVLAGCSNVHPAAQVTLDYLQAKVDSNEEKLRTTLCAANESNARREAASFSALDASLQNVQCSFDETRNIVSCTGAISAVYNGENRDIEPGNYVVVQEDGAWKVCGEG
jgi:outer membrane murein-binding lipoprotein Lpp